uniref:Uncharacterized protein n=1 Tax=Trichobilharzia regenti TaxID=157069 RepID=A0AA85JS11_TRIRE|nr:unnamed protein product [Trichobilharzia regenti]
MPSLAENLKAPEENKGAVNSNQSNHYLSINNNTPYLNQDELKDEVCIGCHVNNNNPRVDNETQMNTNWTADTQILLPEKWTKSVKPSLPYINDESEEWNNQKRICILECHLCGSEKAWDQINEENDELKTLYHNLQDPHCHQNGKVNKNGLVNKQVNGFPNQEINKMKWIEKCKEFENEIKDLKRAKDKVFRQNIKYEEKISELTNKLNSKQDQIRSLLIELEQSNQRLNESETQFKAYKAQTSQNEENYEQLSREFVIMKQFKEQAEVNAKNCENNRLLCEKQMKELDENYEKSKQRYYEDIQGLMSQLDMERSRADELLQKIEQNRRQNEDKIRTLIQVNKKSADEQQELREQVKLIEHLLTVKDQDISMIQFECRLYSDKLKQIQIEKSHLIEKGRFIRQRYQNKARRAWEHCQTVRARLSRRLIQIRYNRNLLSKHLRKQYEQMNRLNNLFWETGWAYVQTQNHLQDINQKDKEYVDKEVQTFTFTNKTKQLQMTTDQIIQTEVTQLDNELKDDTILSSAITWISNDLDNLTEKLEELIKYQGTENCYNFDQYNENLQIGIGQKVSLVSLILGLKCKVNWLRRCCNHLTNNTCDQNFEQSDKNELIKLGNIKKNFENSTKNLKLLLSQMETDALEDELSCVGYLAQTTANQLKLSHLRLEENLDSIRTDLIRLKAECH